MGKAMQNQLFTCLLTIVIVQYVTSDGCKLKYSTPNGSDLLKRLDPLKGMSFKKKDDSGTQYVFKVCDGISNNSDVAAIEIFHSEKGNGLKERNLGRYTQSEIKEGDNWIALTYHGGNRYLTSCNNNSRNSTMMFVCNPEEKNGKFDVTGEIDCYYLFTLETSLVCKIKTVKNSISGGSIFCIIFFTFIISYLLIGFLYQRFVVGAKGYEQIPHYSFWIQTGELLADGCDFVCRWRKRKSYQEYKGVNRDLRHGNSVAKDDELSDRDDNLIPA